MRAFRRRTPDRRCQRRGETSDIAKPENQTPRYRELDKRFDELVQKQRATQIKDHLTQIYTKNGAEGLNAFTNEDMTSARCAALRAELVRQRFCQRRKARDIGE